MRQKSLLAMYEERKHALYKMHMARGSTSFDWQQYFKDVAMLKKEFELRLQQKKGNMYENN